MFQNGSMERINHKSFAGLILKIHLYDIRGSAVCKTLLNFPTVKLL